MAQGLHCIIQKAAETEIESILVFLDARTHCNAARALRLCCEPGLNIKTGNPPHSLSEVYYGHVGTSTNFIKIPLYHYK